MRRDAKIQEYNLYVDNYLPDNQSLLIQLCEKIFRSGFVFHDSTIGEIHAGEWVIRDFFDQQAEVFVDLVSRERLNSFTDYLKNFDWSREQLKTKLFQRIIKAFDRLAIGKHHHFNIRKNIALGLDNKDNHPLYDLLLYVETYYNLILVSKSIECEESENNPNFTKKISKLEDLIKLRNQIQNKLIFRELVKRSLNDIAKIRGISLENLIPIEKKPERQYPRIIFVRPSTQNFKKSDAS